MNKMPFEHTNLVRDEDGSKPKQNRASNPLNNIVRSETNTSCQCSEFVLVKRDAQCQYARDLTDATCCCCLSCENRPTCRALSSPQVQNPTRILFSQCTCAQFPTSLEPELHPIPITYASEEAQTSDHSICLDKDTYPLFMKIVCADKLNEECVCK